MGFDALRARRLFASAVSLCSAVCDPPPPQRQVFAFGCSDRGIRYSLVCCSVTRG